MEALLQRKLRYYEDVRGPWAVSRGYVGMVGDMRGIFPGKQKFSIPDHVTSTQGSAGMGWDFPSVCGDLM